MIVNFNDFTKEQQKEYINKNFFELTKWGKEYNNHNKIFELFFIKNFRWGLKGKKLQLMDAVHYIGEENRYRFSLEGREKLIDDPEKILSDVWIEVSIKGGAPFYKTINVFEHLTKKDNKHIREELITKLGKRFERTNQDAKSKELKLRTMMGASKESLDWIDKQIYEQNFVNSKIEEELKKGVENMIEASRKVATDLWENEDVKENLRLRYIRENKKIKI